MQRRTAPRGTTRLGAWLAGVCFLLAAAGLAAAPALMLDDQFQRTDLTGYLDILDDGSSATAAPDSLGSQFRPSAASEISLLNGSHWLRFAAINPSSQAQILMLQLQPATTAVATLVRSDSGASLQQLPANRLNPGVSIFQIHLPARSNGLFYVRATGDPLFPTSLQLFAFEHYLKVTSQQGWICGVELGLFLMLLVVSGLICSLNHDRLFLLLTISTGLHAVPLLWLQMGGSAAPAATAVDISALITVVWLLVTACELQITLHYPAVPKGSKSWPLVLNGGSIILLGAALVLGIHPAWISYKLLAALLLPAFLLATASATLGYLSYPRQLQMEFALSRLVLLLAAIAVGLLQPLEHNLAFNLPSLLTVIAALDMLMMTVLMIRRGLRNIVISDKRQRSVAAAEAESRVRTELTAAVAHHIRTPVSGVLGMIEMLQDTPLSESQRASLDMIQRAGNELLNAVNELSDVSRLELSADPRQRGSFDMQALIAECVEGFRGLSSARQLELIIDLAPSLPRYVTGDQTRLRQLLLQLIHHAIALFSRGEILLRAENKGRNQLFILTVRGERTAAAAVIGSNTDPTLRPAIARQLIATLDGSIHISEPTASTWRTSFELPLPAIERPRSASELELSLRHRHLLIIDDSATFREVIQRQVEHWGMHVHSAATLSEGLARLNNQRTVGQPVDVLLLDAELPELADPDSHTRLREAGLPTAVMLLATLPEAEHSTLAQTLSVRRVLLKPIDQTSLQLALAEELAQPAPRRPRPQNSDQPLHCLIAEDNPINAQVLQGLLNKLGATSTLAVNGQEAVEAFQRRHFDLIFMDCDMPVMDGFEAARRIREIQKNRGATPTPIIALTANTLEELGEHARAVVMDAHLVKPVRLHSIQQLLAHWTGRRLEVTPA